jgi:alpha-beta hydrolase superfamily lysophospholipase
MPCYRSSARAWQIGRPRGHTPSKEHLYNDIAHHLEEAGKRYPGKPCFLYGHSLGGNLVINYALRRKPEIAGVVATGPELELAFAPPPVKMTLAYIMDVLAPGLAMDSGLDVKGVLTNKRSLRRMSVIRWYSARSRPVIDEFFQTGQMGD